MSTILTVLSAALLHGGTFQPLFKSASPTAVKTVTVEAFQLDVAPVTDAEFARFTVVYPKWQQGKISPLFVDQHYLSHWDGREAQSRRPVVNVSWHAAKAYCASMGGRLPTDYEWQFAAYEGSADYAERLTAWYSKPSGAGLPNVRSTGVNRFGLHDMYGPVWEWVGDFSSLMVESDGRAGGSTGGARFCGAGAASATETLNYIGFMRAAYLSALKANYTTSSLGFRCAYDVKGAK